MTQPTEPVEVTQVDIEARRKLFDGCVIHQQSLYENATRAFANHRVAAERAALLRAAKVMCEGCRNDWPIREITSDARGTYWWHEMGNLSRECKARAIRDLVEGNI